MLTASYGMTVMIVDVKPRPSVRQHVQECRDKNVCLLCGKPAEKRGLCLPEYGQYRVALMELPLVERPAFEARMIREGKLLPSRQGQRIDQPNTFRAEAE